MFLAWNCRRLTSSSSSPQSQWELWILRRSQWCRVVGPILWRLMSTVKCFPGELVKGASSAWGLQRRLFESQGDWVAHLTGIQASSDSVLIVYIFYRLDSDVYGFNLLYFVLSFYIPLCHFEFALWGINKGTISSFSLKGDKNTTRKWLWRDWRLGHEHYITVLKQSKQTICRDSRIQNNDENYFCSHKIRV